MPLSPVVVGVTIGSLVTITCCSYFFFKDDVFNENGTPLSGAADVLGKWGKPNAEFDWCEDNYQWTEWVAEPWNSLTSFAYSAMSLAAGRQHAALLTAEPRLVLILHLITAIGIGSFLFHGTLQYKMQLLDELPMYYLVMTASWALHRRGEARGVPPAAPAAALFTWAAAVTAALCFTPQVRATGPLALAARRAGLPRAPLTTGCP
jgi:hypothetical protein